MDVATTVNPAEARHFDRLAADWWDPRGTSAMLHRLNPARLRYVRRQAEAQWDLPSRTLTPLKELRALDVGCGGGLLSEPLARMGATVTGLDASERAVAVARDHATGAGLAIDYRVGGLEGLAETGFDLICALEVIEHVTDAPAFARQLAAKLAPGGLLILSTPNRTALSRLVIVAAGELTGAVPPGTHDAGLFLTPAELTAILADAGLTVADVRGLVVDPATSTFRLGASTALDYLVTATRADHQPRRTNARASSATSPAVSTE